MAGGAWSLGATGRGVHVVKGLVGLGLVLSLAGLTVGRVAVWGSEATLWADAVRVTPTRPRALINDGVAKGRAGDVEGALARFREVQAVGLTANRPIAERREALTVALLDTAIILIQQGRATEAEGLIEEVTRLSPIYGHRLAGTAQVFR